MKPASRLFPASAWLADYTRDQFINDSLAALIRQPQFRRLLQIHNTIQTVQCFQCPPVPLCSDARNLVQEVGLRNNIKRKKETFRDGAVARESVDTIRETMITPSVRMKQDSLPLLGSPGRRQTDLPSS